MSERQQFVVERDRLQDELAERKFQGSNRCWEIRDLLMAYAAAHRIAFKAAVEALGPPADMLNVLSAIERHFASEINRLYEDKK